LVFRVVNILISTMLAIILPVLVVLFRLCRQILGLSPQLQCKLGLSSLEITFESFCGIQIYKEAGRGERWLMNRVSVLAAGMDIDQIIKDMMGGSA
jgi:hypothetical protein